MVVLIIPGIAAMCVALGFTFTRRTERSTTDTPPSAEIPTPDPPPGITISDEVDQLAQFLAAWQRVTVDRLGGREEHSEVLDKGLLAHVAKLLNAERIVISLVDPHGLRIVDGHPAIAQEMVVGISPSMRALETGKIYISDLNDPEWRDVASIFRVTTGSGPVMAVPMVSGGESVGVVTFYRQAGDAQFSRVESDRARILVPPLAGAVALSSLSDRMRSDNVAAETERVRLANSVRMLLESAGDGIYGIDIDGCCTFMNTSGAERLGVDATAVMGRFVHPLFHHTSAGGSPTAFEDSPIYTVLHGGGSCRVSSEVMWGSAGNAFPVEYAAFPIIEDGTVVTGAVVTFNDITERLRVADSLAAAHAWAIESSRLKSEFLANMSHEIRTPMNGVIGMTGLLFTTPLDQEQLEYAEAISQSADALLTVINDILDFSKIEAGFVEMEVIDFDLSAVLEDAAAQMAEKAADKGLDFAVTVDPGMSMLMRGDPGRIRQVVVNLLSNAVKYTDAGEIFLRVRMTDETERSVEVRVEVVDTGIGVAAGAQEHLFETFIQLNSSSTRRYGGTGLGLTICKRLVEQMGGRVGVDSAAGAGSTFWFSLRLEKADAVRDRSADVRRVLEGVRVLVVDDNKTNRIILEQNLKTWGARSQSFNRGRTALAGMLAAAAAGDPFRLAILDYHMPEMDGIELAKAIQREPTLTTGLLLLTSMSRPGDTTGARDAGIGAVMTKGDTSGDLLASLAKLLTESVESAGGLADGDLGLVAGSPPLPASVLVVEDNPVNRRVSMRMLEKLGHEVDVAANGVAALAALEGRAYDVVLMDCQMPEMDGFEATRELRRREGPQRHTPIIAMTAGATVSDEEKCLACGMDDYVTKPVTSATLGGVVAQWASSARSGNPITIGAAHGGRAH